MDELRKRREAVGLSREQVAARLGISVQTLYRWETGKVKPHRMWLSAWTALISRSEASRGSEAVNP